MLKDVISALDYAACAQIAMLLFVAVFAATTLRTIMRSGHEMDAAAQIPLTDQPREHDHERFTS